MKYIIYKMVKPSHLREIEQDGYNLKTIYRDVLEKLDIPGVQESHSTFEEAVAEINNKKELLKCLDLTILPVFIISYDVSIS